MPRTNQSQIETWRLFLTAHARVTDALESELQDAGLIPLTWYDVLVQLTEAGGSLRMQDLARSVLLSKSGLTRLVDRMEREGLVRREQCPSDRRGMLASATPAGITALRKAAPVHLEGVALHFLDLLTSAESAAIKSAFAKITRALGAESATAGRPT